MALIFKNVDNIINDGWDHIHYYHVNKDINWLKDRVTVGVHNDNGEYEKAEFASSFYGPEKNIKLFFKKTINKNTELILKWLTNKEWRGSLYLRAEIPTDYIRGVYVTATKVLNVTGAEIVLTKTGNFFRLATAYLTPSY